MSNQPNRGRGMGRGRGRGSNVQQQSGAPRPGAPRQEQGSSRYDQGPPRQEQRPPRQEQRPQPGPSAPSAMGRGTQRAWQQVPEKAPTISVASLEEALPHVAAESATGRGTMRGRRRINESECMLTKPTQCATKQGTYGQKIDLQANYFPLITCSDHWNLYEYRVDFAPNEERTVVRKGLLRLHKEQLGAYIFDGTVMYSSNKLVQPKQEMELFSFRQSDEAKIRISIRMVGELKKGDFHYISFFNIVMRKCLGYLDLKLVRRDFYDPINKISVRNENVQVDLWPGYLTSIRQCENNILMCAEITHKVMQQRTVLQILQEIYEYRGRNYEKFFLSEILGQVVLTDYNNNHYRIDDVDFKTTPSSTFKLKTGESISYQKYYETKYGIRIQNNSQPMLVSRSKPRERRAGQAELIYLVPELCRLTGITDEMRSNFRTMNALAIYTKLDPSTRISRLYSFNQRLLKEPKIVKELKDWGLVLNNKLVQLSGRVIPKDRIFMANGVSPEYREYSWDSEIRSNKMLITAELKDWVIVVPQRHRNDCKDLVSGIMRAAQGMQFPVAQPRIQEIPDDRTTSFCNALENIMSRSNPQLILCIVSNNNLDCYSAIKKKCCVDRPCLSQVVMKRTITSKGRPNLTAATKIAIQMNCKLGGAPWTVDIPAGNIMVAGFDVCHDKTSKGRDFGALVATLNKNFSRYYSTVSAHTTGEELSNDMSVNMVKACHKYRQVNGVLPSLIVFYRDGVGEGQIPFVMEIEVEEIKKKLTELYGDVPLKFAFIIVTKRINTRFFYRDMNAPPGTVVDDVVTNPARYDFFLISQSGGKGTVTPSSYNVVYDSTNWPPDRIQRMTYKLTQMYYNYCGPVKVPAPCQYAHKLAALVAQAIQKVPHSQLETTLYYL